LEQQQLPSPVDEKMPLEMPKVEDQLNEARGLLTVAVSSGPSKEARLARVCAGLSSRLQEYKSENLQLEELLQFEVKLNAPFLCDFLGWLGTCNRSVILQIIFFAKCNLYMC
jgi:hypothetical protein